MELNEKDVSLIVAEVIKRLNDSEEKIKITPSYSAGPVFNNFEECISAAEISQKIFWGLGLEKRKIIIQAMRDVSVKNAEHLAKMIPAETKMGRWEDKVKKIFLPRKKRRVLRTCSRFPTRAIMV